MYENHEQRVKRNERLDLVMTFITLIVACVLIAGAMYYKLYVLNCQPGTTCVTVVNQP